MRGVMPMTLDEATPEPPIMSVLVASENWYSAKPPDMLVVVAVALSAVERGYQSTPSGESSKRTLMVGGVPDAWNWNASVALSAALSVCAHGPSVSVVVAVPGVM